MNLSNIFDYFFCIVTQVILKELRVNTSRFTNFFLYFTIYKLHLFSCILSGKRVFVPSTLYRSLRYYAHVSYFLVRFCDCVWWDIIATLNILYVGGALIAISSLAFLQSIIFNWSIKTNNVSYRVGSSFWSYMKINN